MEKAVSRWNAGVKLANQEWYEHEDFAIANSIFGMITGDVLVKGVINIIDGANKGGWRGGLDVGLGKMGNTYAINAGID